jgi:HAD superfamily hydrolase (TIGR01509 family)
MAETGPGAGTLQGLLFDCDGVLADTERDGHRVAFNAAFRDAGLACAWEVDRYGALLTTGGGKERMRRHFDETGWPVPAAARDALIRELHGAKTDRYLRMIGAGTIPPRPGVARLIGEALADGVAVAVCSTSHERAVAAVARAVLGADVAARVPVFAGDCVPRKKPDPAVYRLAAETLGLDPARCVVIEDSRIGLRAALGAGMACLVTPSTYTLGEDFSGAARVVPDLDSAGVDLAMCARLVG